MVKHLCNHLFFMVIFCHHAKKEGYMSGPLKGLKVLDFTTLLPGPYATMCLADMGADVLRVTSGSRPDLVEFLPPKLAGAGISAISAYLGRGKRSLALNLKDPRGIKIVHQLLAEYDIVIEQFRPGIMSKFGLDYESMQKVNPGVIYCSITGYGQTGPLRDRAGHDMNYMALSGVMGYSGRKASGPTLMGIQIADIASGSNYAIIGILAAALNRTRTGKGQYIDISMTDGVMALHAMAGAAFLAGDPAPGREDNWLNGGSLYDFYETKDGRYLSIGSLEPQFFSILCEKIGRPDLIAGGVMPKKDLDKIKEEIRAIMRSKARDEWEEIFKEADACVEPVLTMEEALEGELATARGMVVDVPITDGGKVRQLANPVKFSDTPAGYAYAGVRTGRHNKEVLLELGYTEEQIAGFEEAGVFK
jgi:crotonobetainyl-CoA:carnitine CoA-transferase CaiB-like acyl-CoA transferase